LRGPRRSSPRGLTSSKFEPLSGTAIFHRGCRPAPSHLSVRAASESRGDPRDGAQIGAMECRASRAAKYGRLVGPPWINSGQAGTKPRDSTVKLRGSFWEGRYLIVRLVQRPPTVLRCSVTWKNVPMSFRDWIKVFALALVLSALLAVPLAVIIFTRLAPIPS
jgi:hypothetical protein